MCCVTTGREYLDRCVAPGRPARWPVLAFSSSLRDLLKLPVFERLSVLD